MASSQLLLQLPLLAQLQTLVQPQKRLRVNSLLTSKTLVHKKLQLSKLLKKSPALALVKLKHSLTTLQAQSSRRLAKTTLKTLKSFLKKLALQSNLPKFTILSTTYVTIHPALCGVFGWPVAYMLTFYVDYAIL